MNTQIHLMYRDACNYKTFTNIVFEGEPTDSLIERFFASLDSGTYLVPEQVDLEHPALNNPVFIERFPDPEDDHGWIEVDYDAITATSADPTDHRTFAEFVTDCENAKNAGWEPSISVP